MKSFACLKRAVRGVLCLCRDLGRCLTGEMKHVCGSESSGKEECSGPFREFTVDGNGGTQFLRKGEEVARRTQLCVGVAKRKVPIKRIALTWH